MPAPVADGGVDELIQVSFSRRKYVARRALAVAYAPLAAARSGRPATGRHRCPGRPPCVGTTPFRPSGSNGAILAIHSSCAAFPTELRFFSLLSRESR
ncbi:hypothetical protein F01_170083 [Burkholderia cenocepacia]|nr:hypothetical protein F01_170083 [Burkholderia cenocepacia]